MRGLVFSLFLTCLIAPAVFGQYISIDDNTWQISGDESKIVDHLGRKALALKAGRAILADSDFLTGTIEFDVSFPNQRNFVGVMWRMQDGGNFEDFYMRPHQSGKGDANQYSPVFNGNSGWQLYHGEGYSVPTVYQFDEWMPVKVVVGEKRAEIYLKDMDAPALVTHEFKREAASGMVGFKAGRFATAYFSNIRVTKNANPQLVGKAPAIKPADANTLMAYKVSGYFDEKMLENKTRLTSAEKQLSWYDLACEADGIANLSRLQSHREKNTVFVKINLESAQKQFKELQFGYSDRVKVFVNDRLVYSGNNGYQSRDFRYLGTIGLFDSVHLPLKKGENEILFAVSETFGGWGIISRFADTDGLTIEQAVQELARQTAR